MEQLTLQFLVTVKRKFLGFSKDVGVNTKYGPRKISKGLVADRSSTKQTAIWDDTLRSKLKGSDFYEMTNLQVKSFNNTSFTKVTSISSFADVKETCEELELIEMDEIHF